MSTERYRDLKQMLEGRKREIQSQLQEKIRDVRTENTSGKLNNVLDPVESSEAGIQEDIEFALIQMKAETLNKINEALVRLEEGAYGNCFECGEEIAQQRLRALPVRRPLQGLRGGARERPAARADDGAAPRVVGAVLRHEQLSFDPWRRGRTPRPRPPVPATPGRSPAIDGAPGHERRTRSPDVRRVLGWGAGALDSLGAPDPAAARHGAVPELVHAARGGPRELRPPDRRRHRRREADRRLHAARRHRRGAGAGRPVSGRHGHPHPQDVQAARRQPAADRPGARAPRDGAGRRDEALPARDGRHGVRGRQRGRQARDRRASAEHQDELPAGGLAVAAAVRRPADAGAEHLGRRQAGRLHRVEPHAPSRRRPSRRCSRRSTSARAWTC